LWIIVRIMHHLYLRLSYSLSKFLVVFASSFYNTFSVSWISRWLQEFFCTVK
jgi:hypothetical protein